LSQLIAACTAPSPSQASSTTFSPPSVRFIPAPAPAYFNNAKCEDLAVERTNRLIMVQKRISCHFFFD